MQPPSWLGRGALPNGRGSQPRGPPRAGEAAISLEQFSLCSKQCHAAASAVWAKRCEVLVKHAVRRPPSRQRLSACIACPACGLAGPGLLGTPTQISSVSPGSCKRPSVGCDSPCHGILHSLPLVSHRLPSPVHLSHWREVRRSRWTVLGSFRGDPDPDEVGGGPGEALYKRFCTYRFTGDDFVAAAEAPEGGSNGPLAALRVSAPPRGCLHGAHGPRSEGRPDGERSGEAAEHSLPVALPSYRWLCDAGSARAESPRTPSSRLDSAPRRGPGAVTLRGRSLAPGGAGLDAARLQRREARRRRPAARGRQTGQKVSWSLATPPSSRMAGGYYYLGLGALTHPTALLVVFALLLINNLRNTRFSAPFRVQRPTPPEYLSCLRPLTTNESLGPATPDFEGCYY